MLNLFPSIQPYSTQFLNVDSIHTIYVEETGNPKGIPILFLHEGPGGSSKNMYRRFFNPALYRIIIFDQRGCGKSSPLSTFENNSTDYLILDIEYIRNHLNIKTWLLFGEAWGATLALLYTQSFPNNVSGMILSSVFLSRKSDLHWLFSCDGKAKIYPEYWQEFVSILSKSEQKNIIKSYYQKLIGSDELVRMNAAKHWVTWQKKSYTLHSDHNNDENELDPHRALNFANIQTHFFINQCFINETQLIKQLHIIRNIPNIIIHGRYDMISPLENAFFLSKHLKNASLNIIRNAGHSIFEPLIIDAILHATYQFHKQFTKL